MLHSTTFKVSAKSWGLILRKRRCWDNTDVIKSTQNITLLHVPVDRCRQCVPESCILFQFCWTDTVLVVFNVRIVTETWLNLLYTYSSLNPILANYFHKVSWLKIKRVIHCLNNLLGTPLKIFWKVYHNSAAQSIRLRGKVTSVTLTMAWFYTRECSVNGHTILMTEKQNRQTR